MKKLNILLTVTVTAIVALMSVSTTSCTKEKILYRDKHHTDTITNIDTIIKNDTIVKTDTLLTGPGVINLFFDNMVGSTDFILTTPFTINGTSFQFDHFRYWVSNVSLVKADGSLLAIPKSYYLLEECGAISIQDGDYTYPANKREIVQLTSIPEGQYKGVVFHVGVDEVHNSNLSLQAGELSQLSGMTNISWMWHTSYIFSALKGQQNANNFNVEVGTNDAYRKVELNFTANMEVKPTGENNVHIKVDVEKVLEGIDINLTPTVGANTPDEMTQAADNYQDKVFSVLSVK